MPIMKGNYTIVCNTAAGRRRYMQYLVPQVVCSDIVDRYDIWVNTMDRRDIEFFRLLARKYSKIRLVWQPDGVINGNQSINAFYRDCCDDNTIYIKLDDDIVWIEPGFFEKIVEFRINHPEYFVVSPMVINNQKSTYVLQCMDKLPVLRYRRADPFDKLFWRSGKFAKELHEWFLENYLSTGRWEELHCGDGRGYPMGLTRFSINSIVWFGSKLKEIGGVVTGDDEEFMSSIHPTRLAMANCLYCDTMISHFAFGPQREMLDKANILERYGEILHQQWARDDKMHPIDEFVQSAKAQVDSLSDEETMKLQFPDYTRPPKENKFKKRINFLWSRYKERDKRFIE